MAATRLVKSSKRNVKLSRYKKSAIADVWDLYRDGLSSSMILLFLACQEQFRLQVQQGWRAVAEPFPLMYGTCMHWLLQHAYSQAAPPGKAWLSKRLNEYQREWHSQNHMAAHSQSLQLEKTLDYAEVVFPVYVERWAGDWGGKYPLPPRTVIPKKWKALEQRFQIGYGVNDAPWWRSGATNTRKVSDNIWLSGVRDGVFQDRAGRNWVFDSKNLGYVVEDDIIDILPHDFQMWCYLWAAMKEGLSPRGCVYNVIRRPGQRELKGEAKSSFFKRMKKDITNRKRWDHYFQRFELKVGKSEIERFEKRTLAPIIETIRMWWSGVMPHFANPVSLIGKYGRCAMFLPITRGVFAHCYQQTDVFGYQKKRA